VILESNKRKVQSGVPVEEEEKREDNLSGCITVRSAGDVCLTG
jgi:hypothetical protein